MLVQVDLVFAHSHAFRTEQIDRAGLQQAFIPLQAAIRSLLERGQQIVWHRIQGISTELLAHWPALCTFVTRPRVEPTNNAAERDLRPAVLWREGCFGTHSEDGSRFVERMLTVSTTCAQQQKDLFPVLVQALEAHWAGQPRPSLISPL